MALTADDYAGLLGGLLPRGPAWQGEPSSYVARLLEGLAQEFARIDARADQLADEADPRLTSELLADWERAWSLPPPCLAGLDQTVQQRREALVSAITSVGGQSPAYFIALAASAGYTITITEFRPHDCESDCETQIYEDAWAHAWQVNAPATTVTHLSCTDDCEQPLAWWGNEILECLLSRVKPAHTVILFSYS
jgi:uncharacterized protein YmfQ (DUF2313 family)